MDLSQLPNLICVLRIAMIGPVLFALLDGRFGTALVWFCVAGASDGLDGFLAKRYGWQSRIGGLIDPLADKLLLVSVYAGLAWLALVPLWLVLVVVGRDVVIVTGGLAYNWFIGPVQPEPSKVSKLNTAAQLSCIAIVLAVQVDPRVPGLILAFAGAAVLVTSVVSGLDYVIRWSRRAAAGPATAQGV